MNFLATLILIAFMATLITWSPVFLVITVILFLIYCATRALIENSTDTWSERAGSPQEDMTEKEYREYLRSK